MIKTLWDCYSKILKILISAMVIASGICIFVMILTTCADVILRHFSHPIIGAYDIVKIAGALTLAFALPYTTAANGHVAIEYFFDKLNQTTRGIVNIFSKILSMTLFAFLTWRTVNYGTELHRIGQVTQTLQLPVFWISYVIGGCCLVMTLVLLHQLIQPGREVME
ncbi:MAG: TRAP transporter small permease [Phycisphaerae bacterium]|nr:TRAP transporter small permease [Phycisphaerae bacterium]